MRWEHGCEWWVVKDLEEVSRGIFECTIWAFIRKERKITKTLVEMGGNLNEIRTG
jgi:hypothetical protein